MCCSSDNGITSDDFRTDELTYAFKQSRFVVILWNFCSSILENTLLCGPPRFRKKTIFFWPVCGYGWRWFRVESIQLATDDTSLYVQFILDMRAGDAKWYEIKLFPYGIYCIFTWISERCWFQVLDRCGVSKCQLEGSFSLEIGSIRISVFVVRSESFHVLIQICFIKCLRSFTIYHQTRKGYIRIKWATEYTACCLPHIPYDLISETEHLLWSEH